MIVSSIGEYRHRIIFQTKVSTEDGEGGFNSTPTDVKTVWAKITPLKEEQKFQFQSVGVEATHKIEIRGGIDVDEKYLIKFGLRTFEIKSIKDLQERGIIKIITCKEMR